MRRWIATSFLTSRNSRVCPRSQTPVAPILAREKKKRKRKEEEYDPSSATTSIKRGKGSNSNNNSKPTDAPKQPKSKNTAVYVTSLPQDTEVDELLQRFGKCGVIEEDDEGEPKIKMYARDNGSFSGEALVVFFKEDSVTLAVNLMDEAELRLGDASTRMRVQMAEFGHKQQQGVAGQGGGGERKVVNRKKATKRIGKMQRCGSRVVLLLNGPDIGESGNWRIGTQRTSSVQRLQRWTSSATRPTSTVELSS